jgi:Zn-dependent protease/predicted transcriptional regulator
MFTRGLTIFRFRGIPIEIHISLMLFLPYVAFATTAQFKAVAAMLGIASSSLKTPPFVWGIVLAIGLFVSVLLHEMSHAVVALNSGGKIRSIVLMMLGGVTQLETDVRPEREAWMALAGPLASFGISAASFALFAFVPLPPGARVASVSFGATNLLLGAFNLLPAFPMDGGRVLRGLLAMRLGTERATRVATSVGRVVALTLGVLGLLSLNLVLMLIAAFVYFGASAERRRHATRDALKDLPVTELMTRSVGSAFAEERAGDVAARLLRSNLAASKVLVDGDPTRPPRTIGVVVTAELAQKVREGGGNLTVASVVRQDLPRVTTHEATKVTLDALDRSSDRVVLVIDDGGDIVGLVTPADVDRAITIGSIARPPE